MTQNANPPVLVVVQLSGGNDFMNTLVPYTNGHYYDARPTVVIPQDEVLPLNDELAFNPNMAPLKDVYDDGKMAIVQGIGYANSSRSHFRAMDIWHTCEPKKVGTEGWLGRTIRELDPNKENVPDRREHRQRAAACARRTRRSRRLGRRPGQRRSHDQHPGVRAARHGARHVQKDVRPRNRRRPCHGVPFPDRLRRPYGR